MEIEEKKTNPTENLLGELPNMISNSANILNVLINGLNSDQKTALKKHLSENGYNDKIQEAMKKLKDISKIKI